MHPGVPRVAAVTDDPAVVWAALAPLLAGQPRVRISRDAGKSYPQRFERELTDGLPSKPAAVRIIGKDGTCRAIFLDFDSSVDGTDRVDADVYLVTAWLHDMGARWIADYSPNGGRHIYIPLAERVPFHEAREFVEALGTRHRSLDKSPHQNLHHGCMRTPGSVHKRGGHQMLDMSLTMAYDIARRPNAKTVWARLVADLAPEIAAVRALRLEQEYEPSTSVDDQDAVTPVRGMSRTTLAIATHGILDTARYDSPSEARQAVLVAAAGAGLGLLDVERRMKQGIWPGLAQFFSRYRSQHRFKALERDWRKAKAFLAARSTGKNNARISSTSQPNTQPAGVTVSFALGSDFEHRFIRTWRNALALAEVRYRDSRDGMAKRMLLRALGAAAHMTGSRYIEFGTRSLAIASGIDHTTVAAHLKALRSEIDPLVTLIESGRGTHGDLYMLTVPQPLQEAASEVSWRKGKIHALRPAFRELGIPAALLYEALEQSTTPLSTTELLDATGLGRTAASTALEVLAAWNLIVRSPARSWALVPGTSLGLLAEYFGIPDAVERQLTRYRAERAAWRAWLAGNTASAQQQLLSPGEDYPWHLFEPLDDEVTLASLAFK